MHVLMPRSKRWDVPMKEQYISEINNLIQQCDDISLLDLIHKLLLKYQR